MRLGRHVFPTIAVTAIVLLAGATTAWAAARAQEPGVTTPSPALMALPTGPAPEPVAELIPDPKPALAKSRAAKETATLAGGGTAGVSPSVESGSPAVTTEIVSPDTLVRINSLIPVRATFSEPVSGFTVGDVIVGNGTAGGFTGSDGDAVYTFDVTPNAIGVVTADIPADATEDGDGNGNTAAAQLWLGIPYDDDRDDGISKDEAISAVRDYFDGQLTKEDTIGVISLYFQAIAGADSEVLELTTAMLEGLAPVPAAAFRWEQVNNGSPTVVIANADTARASFTLPALSNDQDFVFRLTVTYEGGHTSRDTVTVTGRPTPGVIVGAVSGHTAVFNAVGVFGIQLRGRPSADVVIPISSSDESEGIPDQTEVVFTPENWPEEQIVSVRGQNANVRGGVQNYEIMLGDAQSADPFYDGLEIANVAMKGISLEIMGPERLDLLIANIPAVIQPRVTYTGRDLLSYALVDAPDGMTIDFNSGTITWTPDESDEGQTIDVTVRVNDGARFVETTFPVTVAAPEEIETEVIESAGDGNRLTVTDDDTDLKGLEIASPPDELAITPEKLEELQEALGKVAPESAPEIPSWITRISDVFVVNATFDNPVELRFPFGELPEGVSYSDINLYAYTEAIDIEGHFWSPVAVQQSFSGGDLENLTFNVVLEGLRGFAFFGYHFTSSSIRSEENDNERRAEPARLLHTREVSRMQEQTDCTPPINSETVTICITPPALDSIECQPHEGFIDRLIGSGPNYNLHLCAYDDIEIKVKNFGQYCRWAVEPGTPVNGETGCQEGRSIRDLASWAFTAQLALEQLGLGYTKDITIDLHPMTGIQERIIGIPANTYGYVTDRFFEGRKTLHIDDNNNFSTKIIKYTLIHEYFHNAQGHSDTIIGPDRVVGESLQVDVHSQYNSWLVEGTAAWFEDATDDSLNNYVGRKHYPILRAGLNSPRGDGNQNPYLRYSFFKLLARNCGDFNSLLKNSLNTVANPFITSDESGIIQFSGSPADASCNFGTQFGSDRSDSLESALLLHNYATLFKKNMKIIDKNEEENSILFEDSLGDRRFEPSPHTLDGGTRIAHIDVGHIPSAAAFSIGILPPGDPQDFQGKDVQLIVESEREILVSIVSEDDRFPGTYSIGPAENHDPHMWFSTADRISQTIYSYDEEYPVPELFVTLINPSVINGSDVNFTVRIVDTPTAAQATPNITSHSDGDQVSNRVITITGSIPEESRDEVDRVVIRVNGLETETLMRSDGSFSEQVLVFLGGNIISAHGFDGDMPVTEAAVVSLQGVGSSSSGRNQLVPTRVAFVLRWDTDRTDVDLYSTDQFGSTIWYRGTVKAPGFLDVDDVTGFGPEVISYRSPAAHEVYVDGTFDVDVHYYRGGPATNFTLDVILNETDGNNRRLYRYRSLTPLTGADRTASSGPIGASGASRFNDIVKVRCSGTGVCQMDQFDDTKLAPAGETDASRSMSRNTGSTRALTAQGDDYEQCMRELKLAREGSQSVKSSCGEAEAEEGVQ